MMPLPRQLRRRPRSRWSCARAVAGCGAAVAKSPTTSLRQTPFPRRTPSPATPPLPPQPTAASKSLRLTPRIIPRQLSVPPDVVQGSLSFVVESGTRAACISSCRVLAVGDVGLGVVGTDRGQGVGDPLHQPVHVAVGHHPQHRLDLRDRHFDRVKIRRIRRQVQQFRSTPSVRRLTSTAWCTLRLSITRTSPTRADATGLNGLIVWPSPPQSPAPVQGAGV